MQKQNEEKKALSKKALTETMNKGSLQTSKEHETSLNKGMARLFHAQALCAFLQALGLNFSVAANTTGKGETIRVWNAYGEETERFFLPSNKVKYTGIGFGKPQLKRMYDAGINDNALAMVQQGKKAYWYTDNTEVIGQYLAAKYSK